MNVVLYEPEIPPNTGSVARLCAATGSPLHLIEPLGFKIDDKHLKRAGLDYWPHVDLRVHGSWEQFIRRHGNGSLCFFSKKAARSYVTARFCDADFLFFGPETRGLPEDLLAANDANSYVIPMMSPAVRSLNLANAVSIVLYEGLRQLGKLQ
ncbi:MAG: tRNA (cytidine(34)-2'-O)-methyltransferase [Deltaproteobacteria bacterium]|nr:tRNA (cytidine(34)-2'-O)-methyltransferase [Deltaproteobacteria bacterium]